MNNNKLGLNNNNKTYTAQINDVKTPSVFQDYMMLVKARLTSLVVFSSAMAYIISAGVLFNWTDFILLCLGGFLVTGAANAFNQVLEKEHDKLMARTAVRPLPTGRMKVNQAVTSAGLMGLIGLTCLGMLNPLAAFLGSMALLIYSFVYTPLKRESPVSITVGGLAGALPTLIGCTIVDGNITILGLTLFAIQFLWQYGHFWAIGYLGFEDYTKAGFKLVPQQNGKVKRGLGMSAFILTILLIPVVVVTQYYWNIGTPISSFIICTLTIGYAIMAFNFHLKFDRRSAFLLMMSSFLYLPLVLITYSVI